MVSCPGTKRDHTQLKVNMEAEGRFKNKNKSSVKKAHFTANCIIRFCVSSSYMCDIAPLCVVICALLELTFPLLPGREVKQNQSPLAAALEIV